MRGFICLGIVVAILAMGACGGSDSSPTDPGPPAPPSPCPDPTVNCLGFARVNPPEGTTLTRNQFNRGGVVELTFVYALTETDCSTMAYVITDDGRRLFASQGGFVLTKPGLGFSTERIASPEPGRTVAIEIEIVGADFQTVIISKRFELEYFWVFQG